MYRLDERIDRKKKKKLKRLIMLSIFILLSLAIYFIYKINHVKTTIHQSSGTVSVVVSPDSQTNTYDEGDFTIAIPKSWQPVKVPSSLYKIYEWKTTIGGSQILDIYQDSIPQSFPVNRELALQPDGGRVLTIGLVSDNCANFTKTTGASTLAIPAKWQGVNFLCDEANYERDVIGTGSDSGINSIALTGDISGTHKFFFVYNNYSISTDFTLFYQILGSFYLK